jgi:hypothetical protein
MQRDLVIARFSFFKASGLLILLVGGMSSLYLAPFLYPGGVSVYFQEKIAWVPFILIAWACSLYIWPTVVFLFVQIVFRSSVAVWVCGDNLIYLNRRYLRADIHQIRDFSIREFRSFGVRVPGICLRLNDGTEKLVPTGFLSVPAEVVLPQIRKAIAPMISTDAR